MVSHLPQRLLQVRLLLAEGLELQKEFLAGLLHGLQGVIQAVTLRVQLQLFLLQPHQLIPNGGLLLLHLVLLPLQGGALFLQL